MKRGFARGYKKLLNFDPDSKTEVCGNSASATPANTHQH
jgi:hypothetical protein